MDYIEELGKKRGLNRLLGKREMESLDAHLQKDEKVIDVVIGSLIKKRSVAGWIGEIFLFFFTFGFSLLFLFFRFFRPKEPGVLVATNRRILFVYWRNKNMFETKYENITSVSLKQGRFKSEIIFNYGGQQIDIADIASKHLKEWYENTKEYIGKNPESNKDSYLDEIEKLHALKEKRIITEEEFNGKKRNILKIEN